MTILIEGKSVFSFEFAVSYAKCSVSRNTKHTKLSFACYSKFRETRNFVKQSAFFREIRKSFRMKISRILYERNSSVNPTWDASLDRGSKTWSSSRPSSPTKLVSGLYPLTNKAGLWPLSSSPTRLVSGLYPLSKQDWSLASILLP